MRRRIRTPKKQRIPHSFYRNYWNKHNIAAFDKYFTIDFVYHYGEEEMNRDEYKGFCQAYISAFPDLHITTKDLIADGDKVTKVWIAHCTHKADFMGIPASDKAVVVKGIEVFRIADGKIAELWACMDNLGMLQQLSVIPPLGE